MRDTRHNPRQLELPLSRDQKLEIVAALRSRTPPLISRQRQKNLAAFLEALEVNADDDGYCRRGQECLAAKLQIDVRTFRRWRQDAIDLEFLKTKTRAGPGDNQADGVDWGAVARRLKSKPESARESPFGDVYENATADNCPVRADNFSAPFTINHSPSLSVDKNHSLPSYHSYHSEPDNCPVEPDIFPGAGAGAEFFRLELGDLARPDRIDEWLQWASAVGLAREVDRLRIFALARSVVRRHQAAQRLRIEGPGVGAFTTNATRRRWFSCAADEAWAARALKWLEDKT